MATDKPQQPDPRRLSSEELAGLIVDALFFGGVIAESSYSKALTIAMEEIDARKAGGDY